MASSSKEPKTQAMAIRLKDLEITLCEGTGEPWKLPEHKNGRDDLACDQLVKGLDTSLPHPSGVALWQEPTDQWMKSALPALSYVRASPKTVPTCSSKVLLKDYQKPIPP